MRCLSLACWKPIGRTQIRYSGALPAVSDQLSDHAFESHVPACGDMLDLHVSVVLGRFLWGVWERGRPAMEPEAAAGDGQNLFDSLLAVGVTEVIPRNGGA
jgi:hypothetical protein